MEKTLLVIRLGIKTAANKEMPNVLLEALLHRTHLNKAVWIYHDWSEPFDDTMRSFSYEAAEYLSTWHHIEKRVQHQRVTRTVASAVANPALAHRPAPSEPDLEEPEEDAEEEGAVEPAYSTQPEPMSSRRGRRTVSQGEGAARATTQPEKPEAMQKKGGSSFKTPRGKKS